MSEYTLKPCPKCGCDELYFDPLRTRKVFCEECDFGIEVKGDVDTLVKRWNNLQREG